MQKKDDENDKLISMLMLLISPTNPQNDDKLNVTSTDLCCMRAQSLDNAKI